jgi:hypothetical protein
MMTDESPVLAVSAAAESAVSAEASEASGAAEGGGGGRGERSAGFESPVPESELLSSGFVPSQAEISAAKRLTDERIICGLGFMGRRRLVINFVPIKLQVMRQTGATRDHRERGKKARNCALPQRHATAVYVTRNSFRVARELRLKQSEMRRN